MPASASPRTGPVFTSPDPTDPHAPHGSTAAELKRFQAARRTGGTLLTWRDGDGVLRIRDLDGAASCTIGRHPDSSVRLEWDVRVSKLHAELDLIGGQWVLRDDGLSRNGTRLNGEVVRERRRLADGDRIRVGGSLVVFHAAEADLRIPQTEPEPRVEALPEFDDVDRRVLVELCRAYVAGGVPTPRSNREVAEALHLGVSTVKTRLGGLYAACGLAGHKDKRAELMKLVVDEGVVSARDYPAG